jgi:hypothetical protein
MGICELEGRRTRSTPRDNCQGALVGQRPTCKVGKGVEVERQVTCSYYYGYFGPRPINRAVEIPGGAPILHQRTVDDEREVDFAELSTYPSLPHTHLSAGSKGLWLLFDILPLLSILFVQVIEACLVQPRRPDLEGARIANISLVVLILTCSWSLKMSLVQGKRIVGLDQSRSFLTSILDRQPPDYPSMTRMALSSKPCTTIHDQRSNTIIWGSGSAIRSVNPMIETGCFYSGSVCSARLPICLGGLF